MAAAMPGLDAQSGAPPRLRGGEVPMPDIRAYGGGEVVIEAVVDERGRVTAIDRLVTTPPFTDAVVAAVSGWTFEAATGNRGGRGTALRRVLVVAVFRPPALFGPAPGAVGTSGR